jgi:hypothetical protein
MPSWQTLVPPYDSVQIHVSDGILAVRPTVLTGAPGLCISNVLVRMPIVVPDPGLVWNVLDQYE